LFVLIGLGGSLWGLGVPLIPVFFGIYLSCRLELPETEVCVRGFTYENGCFADLNQMPKQYTTIAEMTLPQAIKECHDTKSMGFTFYNPMLSSDGTVANPRFMVPNSDSIFEFHIRSAAAPPTELKKARLCCAWRDDEADEPNNWNTYISTDASSQPTRPRGLIDADAGSITETDLPPGWASTTNNNPSGDKYYYHESRGISFWTYEEVFEYEELVSSGGWLGSTTTLVRQTNKVWQSSTAHVAINAAACHGMHPGAIPPPDYAEVHLIYAVRSYPPQPPPPCSELLVLTPSLPTPPLTPLTPPPSYYNTRSHVLV